MTADPLRSDEAPPRGGAGVRGPVDHQIRDQIVVAANHYFSEFGYEKTTVSELARVIGFSKAYIYKFFDSKQAIGEAICTDVLERIDAAALAASEAPVTAADQLRVLVRATAHGTLALFADDRRLYAIAEHSAMERWPSFEAHEQRFRDRLHQILEHGRATREFDDGVALEAHVHAVQLALQPFLHPLMLQYGQDRSPQALTQVLDLVVRGLST